MPRLSGRIDDFEAQRTPAGVEPLATARPRRPVPAGYLTPPDLHLPRPRPFWFAAAGFCLRLVPQTCPKQVGIRLMFLVNPRYHRIECDSCLTSRCRGPANRG